MSQRCCIVMGSRKHHRSVRRRSDRVGIISQADPSGQARTRIGPWKGGGGGGPDGCGRIFATCGRAICIVLAKNAGRTSLVSNQRENRDHREAEKIPCNEHGRCRRQGPVSAKCSRGALPRVPRPSLTAAWRQRSWSRSAVAPDGTHHTTKHQGVAVGARGAHGDAGTPEGATRPSCTAAIRLTAVYLLDANTVSEFCGACGTSRHWV